MLSLLPTDSVSQAFSFPNKKADSAKNLLSHQRINSKLELIYNTYYILPHCIKAYLSIITTASIKTAG
jgi:hypothetical protein